MRTYEFCGDDRRYMRDGLVEQIREYIQQQTTYTSLIAIEVTGGWSAVSSSLEPSPPTGHYCLVPYSVTNCFIKLKSHNPHCSARHDACRPFLLPTPSKSLSLLVPLYIRVHMPHRTVCDPLISTKVTFSPSSLWLTLLIALENFLYLLFFDLIKICTA